MRAPDTQDLSAINDPRAERGYAAVWDSGLLTGDAWANARIWRAVRAALTAALAPEPKGSEAR